MDAPSSQGPGDSVERARPGGWRLALGALLAVVGLGFCFVGGALLLFSYDVPQGGDGLRCRGLGWPISGAGLLVVAGACGMVAALAVGRLPGSWRTREALGVAGLLAAVGVLVVALGVGVGCETYSVRSPADFLPTATD
jgi:hypothetical protein